MVKSSEQRELERKADKCLEIARKSGIRGDIKQENYASCLMWCPESVIDKMKKILKIK